MAAIRSKYCIWNEKDSFLFFQGKKRRAEKEDSSRRTYRKSQLNVEKMSCVQRLITRPSDSKMWSTCSRHTPAVTFILHYYPRRPLNHVADLGAPRLRCRVSNTTIANRFVSLCRWKRDCPDASSIFHFLRFSIFRRVIAVKLRQGSKVNSNHRCNRGQGLSYEGCTKEEVL